MAAQQRPEPGTAVATARSGTAVQSAKQKELASLTTDKARRLIEPMLKHGVTYERILSEVYFAIQKNPKIAECTPDSLIMSVAQCVSWDLVIGEKAYIVPFAVKVKVPDGRGGETEEWEQRAQAIRDYKGDAELVVRNGAARYVDAHNVYEHEEFEYELGTHPFIKHRPVMDPAKRGRLIASYAVARVNTHDIKIIVLSRDEIDQVRRQFSKQWKKHWVNRKEVEYTLEDIPWYGPKTCVHRVVKLLPTSPRLARILQEFDAEDRLLSGEPVDASARIQTPGPGHDSIGSGERQRQLMPAVDPAEPYKVDPSGGEQVRDVPAEAAPGRTEAQRATAATAAATEDPYEAKKASAPASTVRLPFTINDALKGTVISNVSTKDLTDAVRKARAEGDREAFLAAALEELERREFAGDEGEGATR